MECIGLVGGLGIGAACHCYRVLGQTYPSECGNFEFCMVHANLSTVFEFVSTNQQDRLADYLLGLIERLRGAGATIIAIPAVTPHFCIAKLMELSPLPIVDLLEVIVEEIKVRQLKRVSLLGTRYVMESNLFGALNSVAEIIPLPKEEVDRVHALYLKLAQRGVADAVDISELNALARRICDRDQVDMILLAGTDFSAVPTDLIEFPHMDCTDLHLRAIIRALCASSHP